MSAKALIFFSSAIAVLNGQFDLEDRRTSDTGANTSPVTSSSIYSMECPQSPILPAHLIAHPHPSAISRTTKIAQQTTSVLHLSSTPGPVISNSIQRTTSAKYLSSTIQQATSMSVAPLSFSPATSDRVQPTTNAVNRSSIGVTSDTTKIVQQTTSIELHLSSTPVISVTTQLTTSAVIHSSSPVISATTQLTTSAVVHSSSPVISATTQLTTSAVIHSSSPVISETTKIFTSAVHFSSTPMISNATKMVSSQTVSVLVESNPPLPVNPGTQNVGIITGIATVVVVMVVILVLIIIVVGAAILCMKVRQNHRNDKVATTSNEAYGAIPDIHIEEDTYDYPTMNYQVMDSINTTQNEAYATNTEAIRSMLHHH